MTMLDCKKYNIHFKTALHIAIKVQVFLISFIIIFFKNSSAYTLGNKKANFILETTVITQIKYLNPRGQRISHSESLQSHGNT